MCRIALRPLISLLALSVLLLTSTASAITPQEWKKIADGDLHLIGTGRAKDLETARQAAVNDLISRISMQVESQFSYLANEETTDGKMSSREKVDMIVKSYSKAKLDNVEEYTEEKGGEFTVYRFIKKSELRAMFKRRVNLARKWTEEARVSRAEGKIGDALQYYYWALALLKSCPDADLETLSSDIGETNMINGIYQGVKQTLENITATATAVEPDDDGQRVVLDLKYSGNPVVNFNYLLDDKNAQEVFTARNGQGELSVPNGFKMGKLKITPQFQNREEANIHPDLVSVIEDMPPVKFAAASIKVDVPKQAAPLPPATQIAVKNTAGAPSSISDLCLAKVRDIAGAITTRQYDSQRQAFTDQGWDMFSKLVRYGDARVMKVPEMEMRPVPGGGLMCRSLPMSFSFKGNRRTFTEDVVFYFTPEGLVNEVAFGLEGNAVYDILKRKDWAPGACETMIHFLETYKTAYGLKRKDYIESIFSDNALIITGSVVKSSGSKELVPANRRQVKYTRQTKGEYMASLGRCFASNEYINIRFADNVIRRSHSNPDIYGIQIKQDYFSSSYGDTGYLFLMIDFAKPDAPLIHVRTWQPDLDPDVKDGRIGMADFQL